MYSLWTDSSVQNYVKPETSPTKDIELENYTLKDEDFDLKRAESTAQFEDSVKEMEEEISKDAKYFGNYMNSVSLLALNESPYGF